MKINLRSALIKLLLKIFSGLFLITLALVGVVAVIMIIVSRHEATTKKILSQEISKLPVPPSCSENNRQYQNGDIDAISTWIVEYNCNTVAGSADNYIINNLIRNGYKQNDPNNTDTLYQVEYRNQEFQVRYNLGNRNLTASSDSSVSTPIDLITLQLSRAY